MTVTPLYAAFLSFLYVVLSLRIIKRRRKFQVSLGDGGQADLERAIRVHGNFSEYVPLGLLLILMVDFQTERDLIVHALGLTLLIGRCLHAYGLSQQTTDFRFRVAGMLMTFTNLIMSSAILLWNFIISL